MEEDQGGPHSDEEGWGDAEHPTLLKAALTPAQGPQTGAGGR